MRELIDEWHLDVTGIEGQPELTRYFATMDIAEAFLDDPYDWNGPKEPHVLDHHSASQCDPRYDQNGVRAPGDVMDMYGLPDVRPSGGHRSALEPGTVAAALLRG